MKVQPKVQEMESNGKMDDELIREMFKDGVRFYLSNPNTFL